MSALRCPKCGQPRVRRCHREGVLERALSAVYVYPFRCQLCARRFRALQWGKRYEKQPVDRREFERVALRAPLAVVSHRGEARGEVIELSLQGCTARTSPPLRDGSTVQLELHLLPGERPVAVEAALVRSARGDTAGLYFVRVSSDEQLRIRRALTGLYRAQHEETVPPAPQIQDARLQFLRSGDFWLAALLLILAALALATLLPTFSRCVWGVSC
jgi:hypothetical protein